MRQLDSITKSMDMSLSKLRETEKGGKVWHAAIHWVAKSQTQLNDSTTTAIQYSQYYFTESKLTQSPQNTSGSLKCHNHRL